MAAAPPTPTYFDTPAELRAWLEEHHAEATELWVGFRKVGTGLPSVTWPEAVDEALCLGWIDGVRKRVDEQNYTIRFSPRKARSIWSAVNIGRVGELTAQGRMRPAGLAAFERRAEDRSGVYAFEQQGAVELGDEFERQFRADGTAWAFFQSRPPSYRKAAVWWVVSAKREETRRKRLATLMSDSAAGRTVPPLTRPGGEKVD